jgi:hypothetical protein
MSSFLKTGLAALTLLALMIPAAFSQLRSLPEDTERGFITHLQGNEVAVNGSPMRLAPGATIRNRENLIIVPAALPPEGAPAEYTLDADGAIARVWLVTEAEASRERIKR